MRRLQYSRLQDTGIRINMRIPPPLVSLLQTSTNLVLAKSPDSLPILESLDGAVIAIEATGVDVFLYLLIRDRSVELAGVFDGQVDVTLSGSPMSLLSMTRDNQALLKGDVTIHGDVGVSKTFKQLLLSVDVDVEEELSHFVGDGLAHQAIRVQQNLSRWLRRTGDTQQQNVGDYLKEEVRFAPHKLEVQHFCNDVDELRADTDRFEARLNLLMRQRESSS